MKRIVDVRFTVRKSLDRAWAHLADIEKWPSWARHIRSVTQSPPGPLSASTEGALVLSNGMKSTFRMTEFDPPRRWKWVGPFMGSQVHYDHVFERAGPEKTTIRFIVDAEGVSILFLGWLFGMIYRKNLKRAIPNLIAEIEALP